MSDFNYTRSLASYYEEPIITYKRTFLCLAAVSDGPQHKAPTTRVPA